MKLSIICTALLTAISVEAAAIAGQDDCFATGAPCHTLKRAAEAAANAMAEADPGFKDPSHHQCYGIGGMCFKAKREALAQAEAVAEAAAFASPRDDRHHQCYGIGGICFKAKRNALAAAEALAEIEVDADATVQDDVESNDEEICHQAGGPCEAVKRAANAAAEAMAVADPGWKDPAHHQCYGRGGMCFKAKRALDGLSGVVDSML